ncbi:MAG: nitrate reductase molybdenum cofactor assembly chaperone [Acetobacteraceae bacterium]|nr:nitrate reductase molybdenum cofactor assembly chaperone [Acetobacteraceae bacterium]
MRMTLRALAALLGYPSSDLLAHVREIGDAVAAERALPRAARRCLEPLLERLASGDLLDLQAEYSDLFDRSRALSLHLFEHVHGDSKERGQAMLDLGQRYLDQGFLLESKELPDFVPVFLEFASCLEPREAREMLRQPLHVFAALAERLDQRSSPYAGVFHAVVALAGARPDAATLDELRKKAPAEDASRLDDEWEEKPITFTRPAHEMGGPTGVAARVRATVKARAASREDANGDGGRS